MPPRQLVRMTAIRVLSRLRLPVRKLPVHRLHARKLHARRLPVRKLPARHSNRAPHTRAPRAETVIPVVAVIVIPAADTVEVVVTDVDSRNSNSRLVKESIGNYHPEL